MDFMNTKISISLHGIRTKGIVSPFMANKIHNRLYYSKTKKLDGLYMIHVYRGIECGSDHYIVKAKIYIPFNSAQKREININSSTVGQIGNVRYNLNSLHDDSTKLLYQNRLDQKLNEVHLVDRASF